MPVRRWLVSGNVQGVFFRESTKREAARLGISKGHALNTHDGRVDVLAEGNARQLNDLARWLEQGPTGAAVTALDLQPTPALVPATFVTGWVE